MIGSGISVLLCSYGITGTDDAKDPVYMGTLIIFWASWFPVFVIQVVGMAFLYAIGWTANRVLRIWQSPKTGDVLPQGVDLE